jgi:hypothetical protein
MVKFGTFTFPRVLSAQKSYPRIRQQVPLPGMQRAYRRDVGGLGAQFTVSGKIKPADQSIADAIAALADGTARIFDREDASLAVLEECLRYDGSDWTDDTAESQSAGGTPFSLLVLASDYRYFAHREKFNKLRFNLDTLGTYGTLTWEYWNGSSWTTLSVTDGTNGFHQDGDVTFTPPSDWKPTTVNNIANKFWVRVSAVSVTTAATVFQIQVNPVWLCILVDPNFNEVTAEYDTISYSAALLQKEDPT